MILKPMVGKERDKQNQVTLLGKDITSAFNNLRRQPLCELLLDAGLTQEAEYCTRFLEPRTFQICWDRAARGKGSMTYGTPQGSPLSPVLWVLYFGRTLKRVDK